MKMDVAIALSPSRAATRARERTADLKAAPEASGTRLKLLLLLFAVRANAA
jgi:hypothetical protein